MHFCSKTVHANAVFVIKQERLLQSLLQNGTGQYNLRYKTVKANGVVFMHKIAIVNLASQN